MGEVFGLCISEGAISNILARAQAPLGAAAAAIAAQVTASAVVASDETSVVTLQLTVRFKPFVTTTALNRETRTPFSIKFAADTVGEVNCLFFHNANGPITAISLLKRCVVINYSCLLRQARRLRQQCLLQS
jgi:hypothetical protein